MSADQFQYSLIKKKKKIITMLVHVFEINTLDCDSHDSIFHSTAASTINGVFYFDNRKTFVFTF